MESELGSSGNGALLGFNTALQLSYPVLGSYPLVPLVRLTDNIGVPQEK